MAKARDEFALIAKLRAVLDRSRTDVLVANGDDAVVLAPSPRAQVLSVDAQVEGVHFRRDFASLQVIGRRAFVAAASDLAAMGARPRIALLSIIAPKDVDEADLVALAEGIASGADAIGAAVVGGNVASGNELSITHTVVGEVEGSGLTRGGARIGDAIFVTGSPGARSLGLAALLAGRGDEPSMLPFVAAWKHPIARILEGLAITGSASAAIDVSDGLAQDLGHVCEASGVGAELDRANLPFVPSFENAASMLGRDALELALHGGEDYELLFTAPMASEAARHGTRIGTIVAEPGLRLRDGMRLLPLEARGYRHFGI